MRVVDRLVADGQRARRGVDDRHRLDFAGLQCGGDGERLHGRAGLEGVGERAVAHPLAHGTAAIVRVVRGPVGERQDFAGARVENDQAAGFGLVGLDRRLELPEGEILQTAVE